MRTGGDSVRTQLVSIEDADREIDGCSSESVLGQQAAARRELVTNPDENTPTVASSLAE